MPTAPPAGTAGAAKPPVQPVVARILVTPSPPAPMSAARPWLLFLLLICGAALAEDGGLIDRVQLGDNDLDCPQIAAQVQELDALLAKHSGDQGAVRGATESVTRSRTGEVVAGVAKILPFGSVFGDIAKDVIGRRGRDADARIASARARKEYLVDMFLKRGCRVADLKPATPAPGAAAAPADTAKPAPSDAPAPPAAQTAPAPQAPPPPPASPTEPPAAPAAPPAAPAEAPTSPAAPPPATAAAAAASQPAASPRGPLFVLDFRLAFRTRADVDGAGGAPGVELAGVRLTTLQAITDAAYVALLKDLQKAGYEVLNPELTAPLPAGGLPAPARGGDYLYFAPSGAPLAQAPQAEPPGSAAALDETRAALARAVTGRKPGVQFAIGVFYVDFAHLQAAASGDAPPQLETNLTVAAGSHLAVVEPTGAAETPPQAVHVLVQPQDLVSREPYGQMRLPGSGATLEFKADPQRFRALVERQLARSRETLLAGLPPAKPE